MERPIPAHWDGAEAGKYSGVATHVNEAHARVVSLCDPNFPRGKDAFESEPRAAAQPAELVKRVDPIKGDEASKKWTINVPLLDSFELRAAETNRREGEGR